MLLEILKLLVIMGAIAGYNARPAKVSPRYWRTLNIDSLSQVAEQRTDSTLGIYVYTERLENLNEEFK